MEAFPLRAAPDRGRSIGRPLLRLRTDEQLVALFRDGHEGAFEVIHDRYQQRLLAYCRQMLSGRGQDAEDVMQDVFIRAYGALRADDRAVSLRAWLYRVAHNRCVDFVRRPAQSSAELDDEMAPTSERHDPVLVAERRDDLRRLVRDLRGLPDQQRSALLLREMDGLSYSDLADVLECSVPAVKSLLVRARVGLAEAAEARTADCHDIRHDLADAHERGVRCSGRARRHVRECTGCAGFRTTLKSNDRALAALGVPTLGPLALVVQLLGGGSGGAGAVASSGAIASGGASTTGVATGGALVGGASVAKVAVVVAAAVVTAGGAAEVRHLAPDAPAPRTADAAPRHHQARSASSLPIHAGSPSTTVTVLPAAGRPLPSRAVGGSRRSSRSGSGSGALKRGGTAYIVTPDEEPITAAPVASAPVAAAPDPSPVTQVVDQVTDAVPLVGKLAPGTTDPDAKAAPQKSGDRPADKPDEPSSSGSSGPSTKDDAHAKPATGDGEAPSSSPASPASGGSSSNGSGSSTSGSR